MNMTALLLGGPECLPRSMGILFSVALRLIADFQKTARNTAFSGSLRLLGQELSGGQLNGVKESHKTNSASEPWFWPQYTRHIGALLVTLSHSPFHLWSLLQCRYLLQYSPEQQVSPFRQNLI